MSQKQSQQQHNYQQFTEKKLFKDLPFYRRHPRAFVIIGSTVGFLILFSKGFYDFFKPSSVADLERKLYMEKIKQIKLQKELE